MAKCKSMLKTLVFLGFVCTFSSCSQKKAVDAQVWFAMDTVCSVNAYEDGTQELYDKIGALLAEMETTFSATRSDSEVSKLNRMMEGQSKERFFAYAQNDTGSGLNDKGSGTTKGSGAGGKVDHLSRVLSVSKSVYDLTGGALDVTLDPLIKLWDINGENPKVPSQAQIDQALSQNGFNFGAVVKGYATDRIVEILEANNVKRAVIDLGGNVYVYGEKPDHSLWTVGIKNPENPTGDPIAKIQTESASVVTSGNYERYFEADGKRYHHILDPKTGWPVDNGLASVSIISKSSFACDILSTTLFVLGEEKSLELKPALEEALGVTFKAIFVGTDGSIHQL